MNRRRFTQTIFMGLASATAHSAGPEFRFGEEADGFRLGLRLPKSEYRAGEGIVAEIAIENRSIEPLTIYQPGFWTIFQAFVTTWKDEEIALTDAGKRNRALFDPKGPRRKNIPIILKPRERWTTRAPRIDGDFELKPGVAYRLRFIYEDQLDRVAATTRLRSGDIPFMIDAEKKSV